MLRVIGDTVDTGLLLPPAGFALINGAPTILSYATPRDTNHLILVALNLVVTVTEVGGQINVNFTIAGVQRSIQAFGGGLGVNVLNVNTTIVCDPNTPVTLTQQSALTSGAATLYGGIVLMA